MVGKSKDQLHESLSSLVDGGVSELELHRILNACEDDAADVRALWHQHQLLSQTLHAKPDEQMFALDLDFANRVRIAVRDEPEVSTSLKPSVGLIHWRNRIGQFAVAASVAFGVLIGVQYMAPNDNASGAGIAGVTAPGPSVPVGFELPSVTARTVSSVEGGVAARPATVLAAMPSAHLTVDEEAQLQETFRRLMMQHSQSASGSASFSALPYVRASEFQQRGK